MKSLLKNLMVLFVFLWVLALIGSVITASYHPAPGDPLTPRLILYFTEITSWAAPVGFALAWIGLHYCRPQKEANTMQPTASDEEIWPPPPTART